MTTVQVSVSGGFHNAKTLNLRVKDNKITVSQFKKIRKHMCGVTGCTCVCGAGSWDIDGMNRHEFDEALLAAKINLYYKG